MPVNVHVRTQRYDCQIRNIADGMKKRSKSSSQYFFSGYLNGFIKLLLDSRFKEDYSRTFFLQMGCIFFVCSSQYLKVIEICTYESIMHVKFLMCYWGSYHISKEKRKLLRSKQTECNLTKYWFWNVGVWLIWYLSEQCWHNDKNSPLVCQNLNSYSGRGQLRVGSGLKGTETKFLRRIICCDCPIRNPFFTFF